jgi:site-specific DNA recombinase
MKKFVALARVSSREQEREGFSLDVQVDALRKYAEREGGEIVKLFRIAETASKTDERVTFKEMLAYARANAPKLSGMLFYKVDRAARNLFDFVELETFEQSHGVRAIFVSQPTENTPAGKMMRRTLANMAAFYTEQQALDVKDGLLRRVQSGLFIGLAPYGFKNIRIDGRGLIEVHTEQAARVKRIFELYAYHNKTLDSLVDALAAEGAVYSQAMPRFTRSKVHSILRDRAYIGEVHHKGQWYTGKHEALIDRATWDRVQVLLGGKIYLSHETTYGSELIRCGHCGHPITGERKTKKTKSGERDYVYYRCAKYTSAGHPRVRLNEAELDRQVLELFAKLKVKDEKISKWIVNVLRARTMDTQKADRERRAELRRQISGLEGQRDRLVNLRLVDEIEAETFSAKNLEIKDRLATLKLQLDACDRGGDEFADLAVKAFELSQRLAEKWLVADYSAKRQILEIICLNFELDGVTLCPEMRKPFDVLAEGLVLKRSRGDRI